MSTATDGIVTPEAVVLELETAGLASRALAGAFDLLVQLGIVYLAATVASIVVSAGNDGSPATTSTLRTVGVIAFAIALLGYPVVTETWWRGVTVGKKIAGLRVVTVEGAPVRFRHAMLRMMGGLVDRFLPPGGITGAMFVLTTRRHQRIGDLLAGTIVVRDPERTGLPKAIWFPVPHGYERYAAQIDPTPMTAEQYTLVRAFMLRVTDLTPSARYAVADDLATRLATALHHQRPPNVHPETFLMAALARYQRRMFPTYQPPEWQAR